MKCRVTYREDGGVSVTRIHGTIVEFEKVYIRLLKLPRFANSTYEDMDDTLLPPRDENRDKWKKDPAGGVKVDHTVTLPHEIQADIDAELDKPDAQVNMVKVAKLQRDLERKKRKY